MEDKYRKSNPLTIHVILKVKRFSHGERDRLNASVVAGGNSQVYGKIYLETAAPVASFSVVKAVLHITLGRSMKVAQVDMKQHF